MYPHRIRLRGPWEYEVLAAAQKSGPQPGSKGRIELPCRWRDSILGSCAGRIRLTRNFGEPRQIDAFERVWLTLGGNSGVLDIWLNEQPLGQRLDGAQLLEFEVSGLVQARNKIAVEIEGTGDDGLCGDVALEIRCSAYLRGLHFRAEIQGENAHVLAGGEVVGVSDRPLDLYLIFDRATIAYSTVTPKTDGEAFLLRSDPLEPRSLLNPARAQMAGIELVNGGTPWFTAEERITLPGKAS